MAKVSGLGGYLVVAGSPNVTQHNAEYEFEYESENDDVTDSSSTGFRQGLPIIKKFTQATITVIEDDAARSEALGIVPGAVLSIWFKRGASAVYDQVVGTIVKSVRRQNPQDKALRRVITTEFGTLTLNAVAP